jgi:hypothetical protein
MYDHGFEGAQLTSQSNLSLLPPSLLRTPSVDGPTNPIGGIHVSNRKAAIVGIGNRGSENSETPQRASSESDET